jgi:hypothetical protein
MTLAGLFAAALISTVQAQTPEPARPMVVVREADVMVEQSPPPHDGVGRSTAFRMSDAAPGAASSSASASCIRARPSACTS